MKSREDDGVFWGRIFTEGGKFRVECEAGQLVKNSDLIDNLAACGDWIERQAAKRGSRTHIIRKGHHAYLSLGAFWSVVEQESPCGL